MNTQKAAHPDFGMFTTAGNLRFFDIVVAAQTDNMTWAQVYQLLLDLRSSDYNMFGECCDTEVRMQVYHRLGFQNTNQSFYI